MFLHQVLTKLCRFSYDAVRDLVEKPATKLIFLGVEKKRASSSQRQEGFWEAPAWFALGTEEEPAQLLQRCAEKNCYFPTSPNRDLLAFSEEEAGSRWKARSWPWRCLLDRACRGGPPGVVAQARSVLAWHDRHSFCPTCGGGSSLEEGGYKRSCLKPDCRSRQGVHSTCYPRVGRTLLGPLSGSQSRSVQVGSGSSSCGSEWYRAGPETVESAGAKLFSLLDAFSDPVVIVLVIHPDGNQCLLGRKKNFPVGTFSCLAGFIEPGDETAPTPRRPCRALTTSAWPPPQERPSRTPSGGRWRRRAR